MIFFNDMKTALSLFTLTLCALALTSSATARPTRYIGTGFSYSTGKYGGSARSECFAINLNIDREFGPFSLGVSRSYLLITNPGVSVPGVGPLTTQSTSNLASTNPRLAALISRYNSAKSSAATSATTSTTPTEDSADGFGDTYLHGTYTFKPIGSSGLVTSLTAEVKFGTGDADKGLGSGENDYSISAGFDQPLGDNGIHLDVGYQFLGDPTGFDLTDGLFASLSAWRDVSASGTLSAGISGCERTTEDSDLEANFFVRYTHRITEKAIAYVGVGTGLTDASADLTASIGFEYKF